MKKIKISFIVFILISLLSIIFLKIFIGKQNFSKCGDFLSQLLANKEVSVLIGVDRIRKCTVDEFTTNDQEEFSLIEISYGLGECSFQDNQLHTQCDIPKHKTYLLSSFKKIIYSLDGFYQTPDLSLGSDNPKCNYIWTNHLGALLNTDPEHITRSLIKEGGEHRWRFQLTNFIGDIPNTEGYNDLKKICKRTGVVTTNLDGEDVKILGLPYFYFE